MIVTMVPSRRTVAKRQNCSRPQDPSCSNDTSSSTPSSSSSSESGDSYPSPTDTINSSIKTLASEGPSSSSILPPSTSTVSPGFMATIITISATTPTPSSESSTPSQSPAVDATSTTSNPGIIAGSVVGGVIFLALVILALLLYLRARKRRRTPPSSEFMNSLKPGTAPVLRLDSGAEYTPTIPEKGGGYTHYSPPSVPPPFIQRSHYGRPPTQNMNSPNEMMTLADILSSRPSIDQPLHPRRFSTQATNESFAAQHHHSSSVESQRELWGTDSEIHVNASDLVPARLSPPHTDSVLLFAPRFSLDGLP